MIKRIFLLVSVLLLAAVLCLGVGIWQIQRAVEKEQIFARLGTEEVIDLEKVSDPLAVEYQKTTARGHYLDEHQFAVLNRFHRGQIGVEIYTPFRLVDSHRLLMVNRGWASEQDLTFSAFGGSATSGAKETPSWWRAAAQADTVAEAIVVRGLAVPYSQGFRLGENDLRSIAIDPSTKLTRLLYLDRQDMSSVLQQDLADFFVVADQDPASNLTTTYQPVNMSPLRHRAYAMQFILAGLALLVVVIVIVIRHRRAHSKLHP